MARLILRHEGMVISAIKLLVNSCPVSESGEGEEGLIKIRRDNSSALLL